MLRRLVATFLLLGLAACGGSDAPPTTPAATPPPHLLPAGTQLTFVSGETNDPVAGAQVSIGGGHYTTDSAGQITTADPYDGGALIDVDADGFLGRQTRIRTASETRFALWPKESVDGLNVNMTRELVYSPFPCCPSENPGTVGLERVGDEPITLVPSDEYKRAARGLEPLKEAASVAEDANGKRVDFRIAESASGGPAILLVLGPDPDNGPNVAAFTDTRDDGNGFVAGGKITVVLSEYAGNVALLAHELGHVLGLGHSSEPGMMQAFTRLDYGLFYDYYDRHHRFAPAERLILRLMSKRRPRNRYPDNDRSATATDAPQTRRFVCRF